MPSTRSSGRPKKRKSDGEAEPPKKIKLTAPIEEEEKQEIEKEETETDRVLRTISYEDDVPQEESVSVGELHKASSQMITGLFDRRAKRKSKIEEAELVQKQKRSRSYQ
jgi:hypothetical protein